MSKSHVVSNCIALELLGEFVFGFGLGDAVQHLVLEIGAHDQHGAWLDFHAVLLFWVAGHVIAHVKVARLAQGKAGHVGVVNGLFIVPVPAHAIQAILILVDQHGIEKSGQMAKSFSTLRISEIIQSSSGWVSCAAAPYPYGLPK